MLDVSLPSYDADASNDQSRTITLTSADGRTKQVTEAQYRSVWKQVFGDMPIRFPDDNEPKREPYKKRKKWPRVEKKPIPEELRWEVFERDDFRCKICGVRRMLRADHIIPESLGGLTVLHNLQTLCMRCNSRKGMRMAKATA